MFCIPTHNEGASIILVSVGRTSVCEEVHVDSVSCIFKEGKAEIHIFVMHTGYQYIYSVL